jgi:type III secretory pathway component EscS
VWTPGLGSAWAGSLGPGTCLQEEKPHLLSLFYIVCLPPWAWLSVGWLIRSRYTPIQEKSLIYLLKLHCVFAVLGLAQRGLAHEVQVHAFKKKKAAFT